MVLANENNLKEKAAYTIYKDNAMEPMPKFKFIRVVEGKFMSVLPKSLKKWEPMRRYSENHHSQTLKDENSKKLAISSI